MEALTTSAAIDFIQRLYEPGDLLCFGFLNSETGKWQQAFRTFEDAIKPGFIDTLQASNDAGNNIYVAMNVFKSAQRTKNNVAAIRNVWAEIDENGRENLDKVFASKTTPEPTVVTESSPNKFHAIWSVEDMLPERAEALLKAIATEFGGDTNAIDLARVLRIPGFKNHKYEEKPEVEIVHLADNTAERKLVEFNLSLDLSAPKSSAPKAIRTEDSGIPVTIDPELSIGQGKRDSTLSSIGGALRHYNLTRNEIYDALLRVNAGHVVPPMDSSAIERISNSMSRPEYGSADATVLIGGKPVDRMKGLIGLLVKKDAKVEPQYSIAARATGKQPLPAAAAEWMDVQSLDDLLLPVKAFNPDFLPDRLRKWVVDVAERTSVPLDFAGICSLVTIAGVIGRRAFVYPKEFDKEWRESIALSGAVVASSGRTKTPVFKTFTNIVVEKEADWAREHKEAVAKYTSDFEAWDALDARNRAEERSSGISVSTPPPPEAPQPSRRLMLNDATPEKMHDVMKNNPTGLFYFRDELSSWVAEFDKEGRESQKGVFLAAMNGDDAHFVDRIGREGGSAILCASIFGGFQPELLRDFLSHTTNIHDGMIARFPLLIWPDEVRLPLVDRQADGNAKQQFRQIVRDLAEMSEKQVSMHFSPEAQSAFNDWLLKMNDKIEAEDSPAKRSHLSKYKGNLPKLAALLQIVDLAIDGGLMGTHQIDLSHFHKAVRLLEYLESHMHRIYGCIQNPTQLAATAISKKIKDRSLKSGFSIRSIYRNRWKDLDDSEFIDLALELMEEKGWVRQLPKEPGPGRPTIKWEINPAVS
jgi:hypothetical protein